MIVGDRAPDFTLYDHAGRAQTLSTLLKHGPVALFFFPLASSPICTAQACYFRDLRDEFARVGAQRVGISTDPVGRQAHFARQRSFDYPLLSDEDGMVSELFGVRRGRLASLRTTVTIPGRNRGGRHFRRRGLLARVLPVRRTTFVIDIDRTILAIIANEVRASVHADHALEFLRNHRASRRANDWFGAGDQVGTVTEPALEAPVRVLDSVAKMPTWRRNDVRTRVLRSCVESASVAEVAANLSLPLGATRFLLNDLAAQGFVHVSAPRTDVMSVDERRAVIERTLQGLRALQR